MSWDRIPEWIIAGVALFGAIQSWRNRTTLTAVANKAVETHATLEAVKAQTNGMGKRLEELARTEGRAEGVAETEARSPHP